MLVLDEADLLLSFGYEDDVKEIVPHIQRSVQCMLMSATTSEDVKRLQALVLHNPVALSLLDAPKDGAGGGNGASASTEIQHFRFDCAAPDRFLVTMAMLKLGAIKRKVLIFVNSIDTGFQLRLFLERFGIRTALLNAELPLNSRHHILQVSYAPTPGSLLPPMVVMSILFHEQEMVASFYCEQTRDVPVVASAGEIVNYVPILREGHYNAW
jgi:ATP-dependent RNA helicase DDX56/DBP9